MPSDRYFDFPAVPAAKALQVLRECGNAISTLAHAGLLVRIDSDGNAKFLLPSPQNLARDLDGALTTLEEAFNRSSGSGFSRADARDYVTDAHLLPGVGAALFGLVFEATHHRDGYEQQAKALDDDLLIVVDKGGASVAEGVFAMARRAQGAKIIAGTGSAPILVQVRSAREPGPTVQGAFSAGRFPGAQCLQGYPTLAGTLYIPVHRKPTDKTLEHFGRILRNNGPLDWLGLDQSWTPRAYAVVSTGENDLSIANEMANEMASKATLEAYAFDLEGATDANVAELPSEQLSVRLHALSHSEKEMKRLREQLDTHAPEHRYYLQLRQLPIANHGTEDIQRLHEEIVDLQERIGLLSGLQAPQLYLMRFPANRLSALADALKRFSTADIDAGRIEYGYQASRTEPGGAHYLLYSPEACALTTPFQEAAWEEQVGQPLTYWVDPAWAKQYQTGSTQNLVFVPRHRVLSPTLHTHADADMDGYLRELMGAWFPKWRSKQATLPGQAIYLFSPSQMDGKEISIEVLDRTGFRQLRQRLGWINDNLELADTINTQEFVENIASSHWQKKRAQEAQADAVEAERVFEEQVDETRRRWDEQLSGLQVNLQQELSATVERVKRASDLLDDFADRSVQIEQKLARGYTRAKQSESRREAVPEQLDALDEVTEEIEQRVRAAVLRLDKFGVDAEKRALMAKRRLDELSGLLGELLSEARNVRR